MGRNICLDEQKSNGEGSCPLSKIPKKKPVKSERVTLRITEELRSWYESEADRQNKSASHLMREALQIPACELVV